MTAPFEIVPGHPDSPVVLHVPHAARAVPPDARAGIVLDDEALEAELTAITDARTDDLALGAADGARRRPWVFVNRLSRLVVDPERFPDEREEMNAVGMGAVYERTTQLEVLRRPTPAERDHLVTTYYEPYAEVLAALVRERLAQAGRVTILDVHSYPQRALPYERHGAGPRPQVCLGTDTFHTPPALVEIARSSLEDTFGSVEIGLDSPFAGCYVPLEQYERCDDVTALMLEVRRDVVECALELVSVATARIVDRL